MATSTGGGRPGALSVELPMKIHTRPRRSSTGNVSTRTLPQMGDSGPSVMTAFNTPVSRS